MRKEILDWGMVTAIATSGHGRRDGILLSKDKIRLRSVLVPLVNVEDQSSSDLFFLFGLLEGIEHELREF